MGSRDRDILIVKNKPNSAADNGSNQWNASNHAESKNNSVSPSDISVDRN